MIGKLTAYLIRRNPHTSLAAASFFLAHEIVQDAVEDVEGVTERTVTREHFQEAGEELADRMLDAALAESDTAFQVLERKVLYATYDADAHSPDCDSQIDGRESDCTCKP